MEQLTITGPGEALAVAALNFGAKIRDYAATERLTTDKDQLKEFDALRLKNLKRIDRFLDRAENLMFPGAKP